MEKFFIKNRKSQEITVLVDLVEAQEGLVFVMHGLGGFKEQEHIKTFAEAFIEKGYTAIRFDTTNTFGESEGNYENATLTNYYEDLEDVIAWGSAQPWYQEPFFLIGHSLGGFSVTRYAENYPSKVKGVAPISPVVSGSLSQDAYEEYEPEDYAQWKETGWLTKESTSKPGVTKRLKWSHMEDRLMHDLIPNAHKLSMPVLLITGEKDTSTPPKHVGIFFETLPEGKKVNHVIQGAPHTFREPQHLAALKLLIQNWIRTFVDK